MTNHFILACLLTALSGGAVRADDWPQWRGPGRTGVSKETGLLKQWPKDGPKLLWERKDVGDGYSTPAVVGDRIYLMSDRKGEEFVVALSSQGRREGVGHRRRQGRTQPRPAVPRHALDADGGRRADLRPRLRRRPGLPGEGEGQGGLVEEPGEGVRGAPGMWAYSESVLIDGDNLVCTPGGKTATLVALKKKDGGTVWKCAVPEGDEAGYASAVAVDVGESRQYVQFLAKGLVGVDAKTGKFLWRYDATKDQAANIPTPVFHDGCVFTSTSRNGCGLNRIKVSKGAVSSEEVYYNKTALNSIGGVVRVGDYVYGTNARG